MRHRVNTRKLGRTSAHRLSMYRNLVTSLLDHEKVETTHAKAREVGRLADRMITLGKRGDLHARRLALRVVRGRAVNAKLFGELAERYASRSGGYTRVLRTRRRVGDAAEMSIVELVEGMAAPAAKGSTRKKAAGTKKATAKKATAKKTSAKKASSEESGTKKAATSKKATKKSSRKKSGAKAEAD